MKIVSQQPSHRPDYVGVDVGDQWNGAHFNDHRPKSCHWERVSGHKLAQAVTNGRLVMLERGNGSVGDIDWLHQAEEGHVVEETDPSPLFSAAMRKELQRLVKMERVDWDASLAEYLMSMARMGNTDSGAEAQEGKE